MIARDLAAMARTRRARIAMRRVRRAVVTDLTRPPRARKAPSPPASRAS